MTKTNSRAIRRRFFRSGRLAIVPFIACGATAHAYDVTDWLSVGGIIASAGQCQELTENAGASDKCRGGLPVQPEVSIHPGNQDEVFVKLGFAAGNGLNNVSPFALAPWAASLHDDVKDINGRYDYLLNAWYKHVFTFVDDTTLPPDATFAITVGVIDSTDYLDDNAYSNDEYTQFMNEGLVNGPNAFLPSYDIGGAIEFDTGPWSVRGVVMNIGENDDGDSYTFLGGQIGYTLQTDLGEGTYRFLIVNAGNKFLNPEGTATSSRVGGGLSFDQKLGEIFGAWLRFGWQDDRPVVNYKGAYTGGINILGTPWGRPDDNIGIAYGFFNGGNVGLTATQAAEIYYRFAFAEHFGLTADVQYMKDDVKGEQGPGGFIFGLRATAEF